MNQKTVKKTDYADKEFINISKDLTKRLTYLLRDLEKNNYIYFKDFSLYVCYFKAILARMLEVDLDKTSNISLCLFTEEEMNVALSAIRKDVTLLNAFKKVSMYDMWYREYVYEFSLYVLLLAIDMLKLKAGGYSQYEMRKMWG